MSLPVVTMVVVSWNVRDALRRCLQAALASQGVNAVLRVIDNASADGSADMVKKEFPEVQVITNTENRGFAAAVNQGLAGCSGHALLLNPDVEVAPTTVKDMLDGLSKHADVGIIGPRLVYPDGRLQPSVKRWPRWRDLFFILTKLPNIFPGLAQRYQASSLDYSMSQYVEQVMGSCFLIRAETLAVVGPFDEGFWIWFEEVDYCRRAYQAGWKTYYLSTTTAQHHRGASFQQVSARKKQAYLRHSIKHYARIHFGQLAALGLWPGFIISWLAALIIDALHLRKPVAAADH